MPNVVVSLNGTALDPALVIADVAIRSGRQRSDDSLTASSATVELLTPDPAGVAVSIADQLAIDVDAHHRFSGTISEITRSTAADPSASQYTLVAVGPIARLQRIQIPMPLAAGVASARMQAVFDQCGIAVVIEGGTSYQLAAYGNAGDPPESADQLIGAIMDDTGCVVIDQGDGTVLAQFLDSRLSEDVFAPDPAMTHLELAWDQSDDLVNDIAVSWPGGAAAVATSPPSITTYGRHATTLNTGLGSLAAAQERASGIVARLSVPAWTIGAVETWDPAVMDHTIGAIVTLSPLPASSPVSGSSWQGVLEGWTETYGPDATGQLAGTWALAVSDRQHSSETVAWANVSPATLTWAQVNPQTSWSEAVSNEDLS